MPICITHTNYYRAPSHLLTQGPHGRLRAGSAKGGGVTGPRRSAPRPQGARARSRAGSARAAQLPLSVGGAVEAAPSWRSRAGSCGTRPSGVSGGCVDGWREGQSTPPRDAACGRGRRGVCRFSVARPSRNRCAATPLAPASSCPWASHSPSSLPVPPSALSRCREADGLLRGGGAAAAVAGRTRVGPRPVPLARSLPVPAGSQQRWCRRGDLLGGGSVLHSAV